MDLDRSAASLYIVNPLLRLPGAYLFQSPLRGAYLREGVFNVEKTMISVRSPERTSQQSGKVRVQEVGGHAAEDQIPVSE